ncbi:MAG: hypothetical protein SOU07_02110, partial [Bacilli bacterium]|nr:hypothetical protein [Bacilli bacterium]
ITVEFTSDLFAAEYNSTKKTYIEKVEPVVGNVTEGATSNEFTFDVTLQLKWGKVFADDGHDGQNPYIYYNGKTAAEAADTAKQTLQAFNTAAKNATFNVVLTISK